MKKACGMTLVEMLVAMSILSVLMLAFTQVFGGSLRASAEINSRNELINEGQIAQQLIASRLQNAFYIYTGVGSDPNPMQLTPSGKTTRNTVRSGAGQSWVLNSDPFVAMLLPPKVVGQCVAGNENACFTFYAYYPMRRGALIGAVPDSAPNDDPNNENVWVLMEYRANIVDGVNRGSAVTNCSASLGQGLASCPPLPGTTFGTAYMGDRQGRMLVDYVQPLDAAAPYRTMFGVCIPATNLASCPSGTLATDPSWVEVKLRLLQNRGGKALSAPTGMAPLSTRVYPRNTQ